MSDDCGFSSYVRVLIWMLPSQLGFSELMIMWKIALSSQEEKKLFEYHVPFLRKWVSLARLLWKGIWKRLAITSGLWKECGGLVKR